MSSAMRSSACANFDDALGAVEAMLRNEIEYEDIDHFIEEQTRLSEDERAALWYVLYGAPSASRRNRHPLPRTAAFLL